jgi:hypothetical protein
MGLDTLITLTILGALVYYAFWEDWLRPLLFRRQPPPDRKAIRTPHRYRTRERGERAVNDVHPRSPQQDAETTSVHRSPFTVHRSPDAPTTGIHITAEELTHLIRAFELRGQGKTKQAAIEEAFGVSKGKGKGWVRASELWDTALAPAPSSAPPPDRT